MNRQFVGICSVGCLLLVWGSMFACAQQPDIGIPPLSTVSGGPFDAIDLANLNVHFSIPIFSRPGRGIPFNYSLSYDSLIWVPVVSGPTTTWQPVTNWGWRSPTEPALGYVSYKITSSHPCPPGDGPTRTLSNFTYHDSAGGMHPFNGIIVYSGCDNNQSWVTATALDNSGYVLASTDGTENTMTITSRAGVLYHSPMQIPQGAGTVTDSNGNQITTSVNGSTTTMVDTLGTTALTISGTNPVTYSYTAPGGTAQVTVHYSSYMVATHFNVSGIADYYYPNGISTPLVSSITLADNSQYTFTYEPTAGGAQGTVTGRIASVTLPTGGTITYGYGGTNSMMADGSPSTMTRALSGGTWTYSRAEQPNETNPLQTWTAITDPFGNITDIFFSGIYQTAKSVYQGARSTFLDYSYTCYDGASQSSGCPQAILNLGTYRTERTVYDQPNNGSLYSEQDSIYDQYGNLTAETDYDYAASGNPVLRKVVPAYNNPTLCSTYKICDHPSSVQVTDGTNQKSLVSYTYDEGGNTHGSVTTVSSWVASGASNLVQHYSYYSNGILASATDPKLTVTTYSYGGASCSSAFPTSVTVQGLTTSYAYDCRGGVVTSVTDPNLAIVSTSYTDSYYWRPASVTDQTRVSITNYTYPSVGQVEAAMLFNGNFSTYDFVTTADSYGRPWLQQKREGPAPGWTTFDTVATDYDAAGRVASTTSQPASCTLGTDCTTAKATIMYDGAGRALRVTAADGGSVTYTYSQNDALYTVGPAHDGEITKSRNFEYDVLGRLTSVCEVTGSGSSGCGSQTVPPAHGYMTTYGYDPLGDLISVNQGSTQTRTYNYDGIGRMLRESNSENGTTNYTYDSDSTCSSSTGDMVKKVNAAGTTCFYYDALHRLTDAGNGYEGGSPVCRRYSYDSAVVNGATMSNVAGRLAEAKTDDCSAQRNLYSDEGFSYSPRGEVTDVYQSTPHSGGYYHATSSYWDNGVLETISGVPGVPTITYGANQGGRPYMVSASSGQNPITYAAYNAADQLINLTLGSGDTDSFGYDPQTGRFTQYKYNVGATPQTVEGDLTWNQNGTLKTLAITDGTNSAKSQTCTYAYDDLGRIAASGATPGVNCLNNSQQVVWQQTFTYDAFGNISKSGTSSFQPTYSSSTNQFASIPGVTGPYYDSNGNLIKDGAHTYTWDVNWGTVASIDGTGGVSLTYDALGRMVEQNRSGAYTQILYAPTGQKLALMNGQSLQRAFVPLMGGAQAVYNSSGLFYYRHSDWLGSSRLAVLAASRLVYFDGAYAPFGEPYNNAPGSDLSFTGQNQDTVNGLYDFLFRQQSPVQGRWLVPDPAGLAAVDLTNPQTWNRYAYVGNQPLNATDPKGLYRDPDDINIPEPTFCPGVFGCGSSFGDSFWNSGNSGTSNSGSSGSEVDCGWVCYFFSGKFSGTWNQTQQNDWISQQWWKQQKVSNDPNRSLWNFLPQNQNPKAQADIAESQYQAGLPPLIIHGSGGPIPIPVSAAPWPTHTFATSGRAVANFQSCLSEYSENFQTCIGSYSGPELQACVQRAMAEVNSCNSILKF